MTEAVQHTGGCQEVEKMLQKDQNDNCTIKKIFLCNDYPKLVFRP